MKYLVFLLFLISCGTVSKVSSAPSDPDTVYVPKVVFDTIVKHDTTAVPVYITHDTGIVVNLDTSNIFGTLVLYPSITGVDDDNLEAALTYQAQHPGIAIATVVGDFFFYRPHLMANIIGGDYGQVKLDIAGPVSARNTPRSTTFHYLAQNGFCLGVQNCKGCRIENINFIGSYSFLQPGNTPTVGQIDTLLWSQWPDTLSRTNPYCAIVIDPISDPKYYDGVTYKKYAGLESYYLPGMNQGGSTAVDIVGCQMTGFIVGVMITPSMQVNGELINISKCRIDGCKVCVGWSQAQSKANTVIDLMAWSNIHTVFDGMHFGFPRGDGSTAPMIDIANVAGYVHQLMDATAQSFPITVSRVYAEGLYKLGYNDQGAAGISFDRCQINFQNGQDGVPSPDFYYYGPNTTFNNCMLRLYNGSTTQRIVLNTTGNVFTGGAMSTPPVAATLDPSQGPPLFKDISMFYSGGILNANDYDSLIYIGTVIVTVDRTTQTAGFRTPYTGHVAMGDLITTPTTFADYNWRGSQVSPAGFVYGLATGSSLGDSVQITNVGQNIKSGQKIDLYDCKIKKL